MAIGGDQGGSIRMPASWCGIYGMKPTHGLVPYTGIMPIEITVDHTGPMTDNVEDNALMLEVIAGNDGLDPRQQNIKTQKYTKFLKGENGIKNLKIAIVKEGFQQDGFEEDVNNGVRKALDLLKGLGAVVEEVSIPFHLNASAILAPIYFEGGTQTMMYGDGYGVSRPDLYATSMMDFHRNWRSRANELPETVKLVTLIGTYINKYHGNRYYGKATNLTRLLRGAYDKVLDNFHLLAMPTTAAKAQPIPSKNAGIKETIQSALPLYLNGNTQPF
jgi:amidase